VAFAAWWKEMSAGYEGNNLEMESCCLPLFRLEYSIKLARVATPSLLTSSTLQYRDSLVFSLFILKWNSRLTYGSPTAGWLSLSYR